MTAAGPAAEPPSTETCFDVAIIGAGPAGSVLAAILAQAGRRVALLDRARFPRQKLCGEFLSGTTRSILEQIDVADEIRSRGPARIHRARFSTASGRTLEMKLPQAAYGLSRGTLDKVLLDRAVECGATAFEGVDVRAVREVPGDGSRNPVSSLEILPAAGDPSSTMEAGLVVGTYGRHSHLDRALGRSFLSGRRPHVGFKRHHSVRDEGEQQIREALTDTVEMHAFRHGYCGLSFIETGEVNVCMLLHEAVLQRARSRGWDGVIELIKGENPLLRRRLEALQPSEKKVHTVGGVPFAFKERRAGSMLLAGDAAGMIAPLYGDGQAMALRSAQLLGELILSRRERLTPADFESLAADWDRRWRREFRARMVAARIVQSLFLCAPLAEGWMRLLQLAPPLVRFLTRRSMPEAAR